MKILKMKLENFQGVKELEIDPQGESSAIYGDNGTGKSTVYNAFTWLMYGKPSTTEKNYTPKTTGSHNLHHSVEMTVELADGSEMVLKKDYHEVYNQYTAGRRAVRRLYLYMGYAGKWFLYCYGSVRGRERNTQRVH